MPTSTSMSISQFPALRVSGLQGVQVGSGQGARISGVLDQHPDLAVAVVVGVAVDDARSSSAREGHKCVSTLLVPQLAVASIDPDMALVGSLAEYKRELTEEHAAPKREASKRNRTNSVGRGEWGDAAKVF